MNQIFRDLASIVHEQGNDIESIEHSADAAARETKQVGIGSVGKACERGESPPFFHYNILEHILTYLYLYLI